MRKHNPILIILMTLSSVAWAVPVDRDGTTGNQSAAQCDSDTVTATLSASPSTIYEGDVVTLNSSKSYSGAVVDFTGYTWSCYSNCSLITGLSNASQQDGATFTAVSSGSVTVRFAIDYTCNNTYSDHDYTYKTVTINNCSNQTYYLDSDGDGFGAESATATTACTTPDGYSLFNNDCDDTDENVNGNSSEECGDNIDNDCDGDVDEGCDGGACDEDGETALNMHRYYDFCGCPDLDNDGVPTYDSTQCSTHSMCTGHYYAYLSGNADCDDNDVTSSPIACEVCGDSKDNDCDGTVDEDCSVTAATTTTTTTTTSPTTEETVPTNNAPDADAGDDKTITWEPGSTVAVDMDGSGSSDPDGDTLTYSWSAETDDSLVINNSSSAGTYFTATSMGDYTFRLTVTDPSGMADSDLVVFHVVSATASENSEESTLNALTGAGCSLRRQP